MIALGLFAWGLCHVQSPVEHTFFYSCTGLTFHVERFDRSRRCQYGAEGALGIVRGPTCVRIRGFGSNGKARTCHDIRKIKWANHEDSHMVIATSPTN